MTVKIISIAADNKVFAIGSFDYIGDVGHANNSFIVVKKRSVVNLKVFSFSDGFVNWISFQHKRELIPNIQADHIIILDKVIHTSY